MQAMKIRSVSKYILFFANFGRVYLDAADGRIAMLGCVSLDIPEAALVMKLIGFVNAPFTISCPNQGGKVLAICPAHIDLQMLADMEPLD